MLYWAFKSLLSQWRSLISSLLGITAAFLLVILFGAILPECAKSPVVQGGDE
ncbi:MAG: hypothetical protein H6999_01220 [Hahellaceae bacterium]|nr:hypothetical protein [Hahellaceae bacterium]MCP5168372.1 hypothetical protein [Hahellaceae bacterium]